LNDVYRIEKDAEKEFHRSRWWAYKWLKRFDNEGLNK
jgi:transposase